MSRLGLIATIVPLVIVAIGLIGWGLTLRSDVTATKAELAGIVREIEAIQKSLEGERVLRTDLHIEQSEDLVAVTNDMTERMNGLEERISLADNEMRTIMADHSGFNDVLQSLGQAGLLPSGERREYGGYGK